MHKTDSNSIDLDHMNSQVPSIGRASSPGITATRQMNESSGASSIAGRSSPGLAGNCTSVKSDVAGASTASRRNSAVSGCTNASVGFIEFRNVTFSYPSRPDNCVCFIR